MSAPERFGDLAAVFLARTWHRQPEGAPMPEPCTGLTAQWCPTHGTCRCPNREEAMDSHDCPLHSPASEHAETGEATR